VDKKFWIHYRIFFFPPVIKNGYSYLGLLPSVQKIQYINNKHTRKYKSKLCMHIKFPCHFSHLTEVQTELEFSSYWLQVSMNLLLKKECSDIYIGCPRRNMPDFGSVFLMLKYTDITQNTYIQSWTVTEIMAREKCGLLAVPPTAPFQLTRYTYSAHVVETAMQSTLCLSAHVKCLEP